MKKAVTVIICAILLFCGCANRQQGIIEVSPTPSSTAEITPTPTLPPDRGPSAVFTATPGTVVTSTPTYTPTPTPTPTITELKVDYDRYYNIPTYNLVNSPPGWNFEYGDYYFAVGDLPYETREELFEKGKKIVQAKFDEFIANLDSLDTLYVRIDSRSTENISPPRIDESARLDFYIIINGKTLEKWKELVKLASLQYNEHFVSGHWTTGGTYDDCFGSSFIYYVEGIDGDLHELVSADMFVRSGMDNEQYIAILTFPTDEIKQQYYALQTAIEDEMLARYYEIYDKNIGYPFAEIYTNSANNKTSVGEKITDKHLIDVGFKPYEFEYQFESIISSTDVGKTTLEDFLSVDQKAIYLCVEKNGKKYYAAFAQQPYYSEFINIIKNAKVEKYSGNKKLTTNDGCKITYCFLYRSYTTTYWSSVMPTSVFCTNGIICDEDGNSIYKLVMSDSDKARFNEIQAELCKAVVSMRTAESSININPVVSNI